jgi:hypothetical protein
LGHDSLLSISACSDNNFNNYTPMADFRHSICVPVKFYLNADTDKSKILSDNKGKAGVYLFTHKESGKICKFFY